MTKRKVKVFDTTMRDGEQTPRVSMSLDSKMIMTRELVEMGIDVVEIGFPGASPADYEAGERASLEFGNTILCGFARTHLADIDAAGESLKNAKHKRIHIVTSTSDLHIKDKLGISKDRVLEMMEESIKRALEYTDDVAWIAEDCSRTDKDFMVKVFQHALDMGVTTLTYADTCGYALPRRIEEHINMLMEKVDGWNKALLGIHCHNDLGMAVANTLTAIKAGAGEFQGCINGIGERAGNASLAEIIMAIKLHGEELGDVYTEIDTSKFKSISELVSRFTNIPVPVNFPIVGANAFAHSSGIHQDGIIKNSKTYEIMDPKEIGLKNNSIIIDRHSGRKGIAFKLAQIGVELKPEELDELFTVIKEELSKTSFVSDELFNEIVSSFVQE